MEILLLLIGLVAGFAAAWFIAKFKFSNNSGSTLEACALTLLQSEGTKVSILTNAVA